MRAAFWPLFLALALLVGACVPATQPPAPGGEVSAQPKYGGIVRYAGTSTAANYNPFIRGGRWDMALGHAYDRLVHLRNDNEVPAAELVIDQERGLAASWELKDETTYIFNLRKGVKWHDGQPFTADDVVFTIQWAKDPKNLAKDDVQGVVSGVKEAQALDPNTVRITTVLPDAGLVVKLTEVHILPKHIFDRGQNLEDQVVGTGPFRFKEGVKGQRVVTQRNPDYYVPGKPYLDEIELSYGLDMATQLAAFIAGNITFQVALDRSQFESAQASRPQMRYLPYIENFNNILHLQQDRPPFSDLRVRKAMHLALDRKKLNELVAYGEGALPYFVMPHLKARGGWSIPEAEYINEPGYRQPKDEDLREAKRLMAEAGYPSGFKTNMKFQTGSTTTEKIAPPITELMRASLGIEIEQRSLAAAVVQKDRLEKNFEIILYGGEGVRGDPGVAALLYYSKSASNFVGVNDPELDRLIEEQGRTFDVKKRQEVFHRIQRRVATQVYSVPTINLSSYFMMQPELRGIGPPPKAIPDIDTANVLNVWLERG